MPVTGLAVVVMGVSGAGKTTVGRRLAEPLGVEFIDGDDLHTDQARAKMRWGLALTDDDRWPWLDRVGGALAAGLATRRGAVVACSALRRAYRDRLRAAVGPELLFIYLAADAETMRERVGGRQGHYMPASLVDSQFAALEPPRGEADVIEVLAETDLAPLIPQLVTRLSETVAKETDMNDISSPKVAVVGVGVMGGAIAARLLETGASVAVFDPDAAKLGPLGDKGARAATSPAEATRGASFVITSLNSAKVVEAAVFGPGGVASAANAQTLLIDMSSIDPESTRALAERFHQVTGGCWLDCPLSGGAPGASSGKLTVMAGGAEADFERARAVMSRLTANYTLMGPVGAGQATKLVNQVLCAIQFQAVAEAVALAERAGVSAAHIPAALAGGRADSHILQEFGAKMARRDFSPTGRLDNMLKDLDGVQALARATKTPLPVTAIVAEIHRALVGAGLGGEDNAALMRQFDGPRENSSRL